MCRTCPPPRKNISHMQTIIHSFERCPTCHVKTTFHNLRHHTRHENQTTHHRANGCMHNLQERQSHARVSTVFDVSNVEKHQAWTQPIRLG